MRKPLINPGIIKRLKSFFAIIQDTDTATRYIPVGKYVLYKNIACHASQNIESGDTLALGTNLVTDSDGFINCLNDDLGTKVNTSDIVNVLTSTDSTKPLSAAQGKALNDSLTTLNGKFTPTEITTEISGVAAIKSGNVVQLQIITAKLTNAGENQWYHIGQLPQSIRPRRSTIFFAGYDNSAADRSNMALGLQINGLSLFVWLKSEESASVRASICYITDS